MVIAATCLFVAATSFVLEVLRVCGLGRERVVLRSDMTLLVGGEVATEAGEVCDVGCLWFGRGAGGAAAVLYSMTSSYLME